MLKGPSDNIHESSPALVTNPKLRSRYGKTWYLETDRSDRENIESTLEDDRIDNGNAMTADGITDKAEEVGSDTSTISLKHLQQLKSLPYFPHIAVCWP